MGVSIRWPLAEPFLDCFGTVFVVRWLVTGVNVVVVVMLVVGVFLAVNDVCVMSTSLASIFVRFRLPSATPALLPFDAMTFVKYMFGNNVLGVDGFSVATSASLMDALPGKCIFTVV